ncbi:hypothetical protein [Streptomyces sp. NBC_01304]|uniref:hypothetical protein n=1 Tax=Streptomyces sp. NBC_01304 TaxID=2903818 RepID=UPI002E0EFB16|nr:hypothetical protein OG430_42155 [Streptomyces sp. NBC_01304]
MSTTKATHVVSGHGRDIRQVVRRIQTQPDSEKWYRQGLIFELFEEPAADTKHQARSVRISTHGTAVSNAWWLDNKNNSENSYQCNFAGYFMEIKPMDWDTNGEEYQKPGSWRLMDFSPTVGNRAGNLSTSTTFGGSVGFFGPAPMAAISFNQTTSYSWPADEYTLNTWVSTGSGADRDAVSWKLTRTGDAEPALIHGAFKPHLEAIFSLSSDTLPRRYSAFTVTVETVHAKGSSKEGTKRRFIQHYAIDWQEGEVYALGRMLGGAPEVQAKPVVSAMLNKPAVTVRDRFSYRSQSPIGTSTQTKDETSEVVVPDGWVPAYKDGFTVGMVGKAATFDVPHQWIASKRAVRLEKEYGSSLVWISPDTYTGGFASCKDGNGEGAVVSLNSMKSLGIPEIPDAIQLNQTGESYAFWADGTYPLNKALTDRKVPSFDQSPAAGKGITAGFFSGRDQGKGFAIVDGIFRCYNGSNKEHDTEMEGRKVTVEGVKDPLPVLDAVKSILGTQAPDYIVGFDSNDGAGVFFFAGDRVAALNMKALLSGAGVVYRTIWPSLISGTSQFTTGSKATKEDPLLKTVAKKFCGLRPDYPVSGYICVNETDHYFFHPADSGI